MPVGDDGGLLLGAAAEYAADVLLVVDADVLQWRRPV
jgi:hypothetical protein